MTVLQQLLADLAAEGTQLEELVRPLDAQQWRTPTPAAGWDIATQIGHLAWTDEVATKAASDKEAWDEVVTAAITAPEGPENFVDVCAQRFVEDHPAGEPLLAAWRDARETLVAALDNVPQGTKLPWFGPPMSPLSMATARFMETWAHSLDVHDALGVPMPRNERVRHVAHLGVRTRNFAFLTNDLTPPSEEFSITLTSPTDEVWEFGDPTASQSVTGSAYDFARLVTQRVHRDDTDLNAVGDDAQTWLRIAQAFAGPPGEGRRSN